MNIKRIMAVVNKERKEIVRDKLFFSLAFFLPVMLMILFGYGLSFDVENIPFAIIDRDHTNLSRDYAYHFISSRYFDFKGYCADERELDPLLAENKLRAFIIIPEHFQKDILHNRPVSIQTIIDGTYPSRADITRGYVSAINNGFSMELISGYLSRLKGIPVEQARALLQPIRLEVRFLYNQSVKSIWSVAPKLMMAILLMTPPFLTALGIVREKESGSIFNIYASTVSRLEFLIGKLTPYVAISVFNSFVLYLMARFLFGAPFKGDLFFFAMVTVLYVICTTGIGLVVSTFARTQIAAIIVTSILTIVPAALYSGVLIPISSLSKGAQIEAHMMPAMYYTNIVLGSFLKGTGITVLWMNVAVLAVYALILFTTGYLLFTKRPRT
jgi:ABC-2 type transport system permease protein/ribosome-dependent ATPase